MKYKDAIKKSMEMLARDDRVRFIGYNTKYGSRAYGTLRDISPERCIETPLAENLMCGLAMGMSLEGFKPVLFFERQDFILNGLDAIVNHIDKIDKLSHGEYQAPVIIRATVGGINPIDPGIQHTQDHTLAIKEMVSFPVVDFSNPSEIITNYQQALNLNSPILLVERRDLYETE
jgi:pyruvate/2-oxoglutarate/acetoin dehydrogenase E1 component